MTEAQTGRCHASSRLQRCLVIAALGLVAISCSSSPVATEQPPDQPAPQTAVDGIKLLAHRGVHQTFSLEGVDDTTCTADRIDPLTHEYIENTLPSIEAAFAAGATVVELDIAATTDGVLAVFHDWELDCRTNGSGAIRSWRWDDLAELDVGHGYTSDGQTYPLRGTGVGLMPRLEDVFAAFPHGQFLINFKSNDANEAALLQAVVSASNASDQVWAVYGGSNPVVAYVEATGARGFTQDSIVACLTEYAAQTDTTDTLASCTNTAVIVPANLAPILPGWPEQFVQAMASHDSIVVVSGAGDTVTLTGIDTQRELDALPQDLDIYVWTDKVEDLTLDSF